MDAIVKEKGITKKEEVTSNPKTAETTILDLIKIAVEKGDTETLRKLIELKEQSQKENAKNEFFKALHGFQSELQPIKRSKVVFNKDGTIRYKYATFDDIVKAIQPLLKKYGLTFHFKQEFDKENQTITVYCIITHVLGHQEVISFKAPLASSDKMQLMQNMQNFISILTYAKRYSFSLALGLATEEDENLSEEEHPYSVDKTASAEPKVIELPKSQEYEDKEEVKISEEKSETKSTENKITESQKRYIIDLLKRYNLSIEELLHHVLLSSEKSIASIDELTKTEASKLIDALKRWNVEKKTVASETTINETVVENDDIPF
jgi:hypothetical protein